MNTKDRPTLPDPPSGLEWAWCGEARVGVLKPTGWHFKKVVAADKTAFFITREDIDDEGSFKTGLTLNVISDVRKKSGLRPSAYAAKYVASAVAEREVLKQWSSPPGRVATLGCLVRNGEKGKGTKVHYFLVADDRADTLYLFFFEAPEAEWDEAWLMGDTILKKLYLEIKP